MTLILETTALLQDRLATAAAARNMSVEQYALHVLDVTVSLQETPLLREEDTGRPTLADVLRGKIGTVHSGGNGRLSQEDSEGFADHLAAKREAGTL